MVGNEDETLLDADERTAASGPGRATAPDLDAPTLSEVVGIARRRGGRPAWIAGYEVLSELGRGGMGVVYRARDEKLGREVALKVLHAHDTSAEARRRFELEARAAARLRHPNIVAVHESGEDETGAPYVVMELVRGPSLRDVLRREGPMAPRAAARLVETLARALGAAHAQGVLHRDVKPQNVLLSQAGDPMLADFGLAKALDSADGPTSTGQVLGTPSYMSPEQADGDPTRLGPPADVWSLGATLYELLTGRPPFAEGSVVATLAAVLNREPAPPSRLRPGLDRDLETIVLTCLEKEPARRYPTAAALADDLERWRRGRAVAARPAGLLRRASRLLRRHPGPALAAALAVALLASLAVRTRAAGARTSEALATLAEARALARRGRSADEVAPLVSRALVEGGRTPALLVEGALACEAAGLAGDARALLEEAAREHPPAYEALLELHRLELRADPRGSRMTPALDELIARASARGEEDEFSLFARAERAAAAGDLRSALAILDRLLRLAPGFAWGHVDRANVHDALGDPAAARRDLDRALELDPELAVAWSNRASLRGAQGDLAGARADVERALALDPRLAAAWALRGALRRADAPGAALEDLRRAVALDPGLAPAHLALGRAHLERARTDLLDEAAVDHLDAAGTHLDQVVVLDPQEPEAWALRGDVRALQGDPAGARADYDRALDLAPDLRQAWYGRGVVCAELGALTRALEDLDRALALEPVWADAYWQRALVRLALADPAGARDDLDNAVAVDPRHADALLSRGTLRLRQGEAGGEDDLRRALGLLRADDPRRAEVQRLLE